MTKDDNEEDEYFMNMSFYGKSKLGDWFMIRLAIFKDDDIDLTFTLRSKEQTLGSMIDKRMRELRFEIDL